MNYPDYNTYNKLYGRYLKRGPEKFFAKRDPEGKSVLDLCSGGGQLSKYALEHGATNVLQVDLACQMLDPNFKGLGRTNYIEGDVEGFLAANKVQYDMMVCRQGANYWFLNVSGEEISNAVKKRGMFVFNTFGKEPPDMPMVKCYYHGGIEYREVSFLFDGRIHHVQTAKGMEPHFTVFDWISHDAYTKKLSPYFILDEVVDGPSSMWYCTKI